MIEAKTTTPFKDFIKTNPSNAQVEAWLPTATIDDLYEAQLLFAHANTRLRLKLEAFIARRQHEALLAKSAAASLH